MQEVAPVRDTAIRLENEFGFVVYRWDQEYMPFRRRSLWDDVSHLSICPVCTESWDPWVSQAGTTFCPFCGTYLPGLRRLVSMQGDDVNPVVWSLEKTRYRELAGPGSVDTIPVLIPGSGISAVRVGQGIV